MKKTINKNSSLLAIVGGLGLVLAAGTGHARPDRKGPPKHPPQEAIDACEESEAGDACEFTHRDREITGVCRKPPSRDDVQQGSAEEDEKPLACVPNRRPPPHDDDCDQTDRGN